MQGKSEGSAPSGPHLKHFLPQLILLEKRQIQNALQNRALALFFSVFYNSYWEAAEAVNISIITKAFSACYQCYKAILVRFIHLNNQKESKSPGASFRNKDKIAWWLWFWLGTILGMHCDPWLLSRALNRKSLSEEGPVPSQLTWAGLSLHLYHLLWTFLRKQMPYNWR